MRVVGSSCTVRRRHCYPAKGHGYRGGLRCNGHGVIRIRLLCRVSYSHTEVVRSGRAQADGSPWRPDSISTLYAAIVKRAKLGHVRFHDLRHSYASQMLRLGIPAKVVSESLGHSNIGITIDTYSHVLPGMQENAAALMDTALRSAISQQQNAG